MTKTVDLASLERALTAEIAAAADLAALERVRIATRPGLPPSGPT